MSPKDLSDVDLMKAIARESLKKFGTIPENVLRFFSDAPQAEQAQPAPAGRRRKQPAARPAQTASARPVQAAASQTDWSKVPTTCSKCGLEGFVLPDFGIRVARGVVYKQSRCKACRATEDYKNRPRRYKSKNNR